MAKIYQLLEATRIDANGNVVFNRTAADGTATNFEVSDSVQVTAPTGSVEAQAVAEVDRTNPDAVLDLTDFTEARLSIVVYGIGAGTEKIRMGYATFEAFTIVGFGDYLTLSAPGLYRTDWTPLPAAARTIVNMLVLISLGDAATATTYSPSIIELRH